MYRKERLLVKNQSSDVVQKIKAFGFTLGYLQENSKASAAKSFLAQKTYKPF